MPTHFETDQFQREFDKLGRELQGQFVVAVGKLIEDLTTMEEDPSAQIRTGLRVKPYRSGEPGDMEMTYAPNGRALFCYGEPIIEGKRHIEWLRVGTHEIF